MLNERMLEDYICDNEEQFIITLKSLFGEDSNIKFLGRQMKIGDENITDLIYKIKDTEYIDEHTEIEHTDYIIVELKNRMLEAKDIGQLCRYMTTLEKKIKESDDGDVNVIGVFVSWGCDRDMQCINMLLNNYDLPIYFVKISNNISFNIESFSFNQEYIQKIKLDKRFDGDIEDE